MANQERQPETRITASKEQVEAFAVQYKRESESDPSIHTHKQRAEWIADRIADRLGWRIGQVYSTREGWVAEFFPGDGGVWGSYRVM